MYVAIQKIKTGAHIEQQTTEEGVVEVIVPEYEEHKSFIAETREELEELQEAGTIQYERIEEYEYAEMYAGNIYTDRTECVNAKNADIKQRRANLYTELVDPLHAQKNKDTIMGEWTEEKEQAYIAEVKRLTIMIREDNPYIE